MDTYTKVTTKGYGSRIMDSFKGIIFGFIMFIASFFVLWINEGTVDMSEIAKTSIETSDSKVDLTLEGKFVSVTGEITSDEKIGDDLFLKPGAYISVDRKVEMYSWVEEEDNKTEKNLGGSETTTTTYKYVKKWVEDPEKSSDFEIQKGHINPEKSLVSITKTVNKAKVGVYNIDAQNIVLPSKTLLSLNEEVIDLEKLNNTEQKIVSTIETTKGTTGIGVTTKTINVGTSLVNGYLFQGQGTISSPVIGDIRISYSTLNDGSKVTVMGKQNGDEIESYMDDDGNVFFRVFHGSKADAIKTLRSEYLFKLWLFRALGFVLMWVGLALLLGPISTILDVLPFLGSLGRGIIGLITFVIAFVLSIITILISMIFHNIFALIITIGIVGFVLYKYVLSKKLNIINKEKIAS